MLINEVYESVLDLANKEQLSGYLNADSFNLKANLAQLEIVDELVEFLDFNQTTFTLLSDVLKTDNASVGADGYVGLPSDYYKYADSNALLSDGGVFSQYPIDYIGTSERGERINSKIVSPTITDPIATETQAGLRVEPVNISVIELTYVATPSTPEWVGTDTVPPVFDPALSTDFTLSDKFKTILVYKICSMFGIEVKDVNLYQSTTKGLLKSLQMQ